MPSSKEPRLPIVGRTMELLKLLFQGPRSADELAQGLGIIKVSVYRHIWSLQKKGIPIQTWRVEGSSSSYRYVMSKQELWKWFSGDDSEPPMMRKHEQKCKD